MIRFADITEIDELQAFIDREWRKGHILARDRAFFEWMYLQDGRVNFAISKNDGGIDGILGFVPYDEEATQMALTVWKALKSENGLVGMSLLAFIEKELRPSLLATPGINPDTTAAIYKYFKHEVGKMKHYYRLAKKAEYHIADHVGDVQVKGVRQREDVTVSRIDSFEDFAAGGIRFPGNAIQKDAWYIRRRYFEHPVFTYIHYLIKSENGDALDVVLREQETDGHKCIRIVDLLGAHELLASMTPELDALMIREDYEYADCYAGGVDDAVFGEAGWADVDASDIIIPNHFAPFERKNVDLYYSCKPRGIAVFRGDGDQDRPN